MEWQTDELLVFVVIAMLLGVSFPFQGKETYTKVKVVLFSRYKTSFIPQVSVDFKKFYSVNVLEEWKQNNSSTSLVFEDFSMTKVVDGFFALSQWDQDKQLAKLTSAKKGENTWRIFVKSNQLPILDDFLKYAKHISELLKNEYLLRAKEEIRSLRNVLKIWQQQIAYFNTVLSIDRYIVTSKKGASAITIPPKYQKFT